MEGARIGVFDDEKAWQDRIQRMMSRSGHTVVMQPTTFEGAKEAINNMDPDALDAAVVDGNYDPSKEDGAEGAELVRRLHEKNEGIIVIGFSGTGKVEGADRQVDKTTFELDDIPAIIREI